MLGPGTVDFHAAPKPEPTAVVLGGGIAGLLSAHAACKHFGRVVLLDKDQLRGNVEEESVAETGKRRAGVPQFCHPHVLMMGGLRAIEELLPGFTQEVQQRGGLLQDMTNYFHIFDFGTCNTADGARGPGSFQCLGASRRLLEQTLQERVVAENGGKLSLRGGARAVGLAWSEDRSAVTGVVLQGREVVPGDLVIDASGRFSCLPAWLEEASWAVPAVRTADPQLCYSSCTVQLPPEGEAQLGAGAKEVEGTGAFSRADSATEQTQGASDAAGAKAGGLLPNGGKRQGIACFGRSLFQRGASFLPQESGTAAVLLYGVCGERAPTDEQGWLNYAASLPDQTLYRTLLHCKRISPIIKYAGLKNVLHCYHEMEMPSGLVAVGDSVMQLNPIYAHGMSVAAIGVQVLDQALGAVLGKASTADAAGTAAEEQRAAALRQLARTFQRDLFSRVSCAWMMATSEDCRYPCTRLEGVSKPPRLLAAFLDLLGAAAMRDRETLETFFKVGHFILPMPALFAPRMLWQAAKQAARQAVAAAEGLLPLRMGGKAA